MPRIQRADLLYALENKFGFEAREGRKHQILELTRAGRKLAWTSVSRGTQYRELGAPIVSGIARQLFVNPRKLVDMISCTVSAEQYVADLKMRDDG